MGYHRTKRLSYSEVELAELAKIFAFDAEMHEAFVSMLKSLNDERLKERGEGSNLECQASLIR